MNNNYFVVQRKGLASLIIDVNAYIELGYMPIGGITIDLSNLYLQAIYRPEPKVL